MSGQRFRYKAFISYSHRDTSVAQWLHRALETYRAPRQLIGQQTPTGTIERRLGSIFRDRDELPVAADLTGQINDALSATQFLIVLCSTASAQSKWVNQEVINFKRLKGPGSIIAVIVDGQPYASLKPGHEAEECFVPALRYQVTSDGELTDQAAEPIAADLRPGKDGKRMVKLKVLAGLLGVGLDALVQRETQRRQRFMTAVTFASLAGIGVMGALTFNAIEARNDAEVARGNAERRRNEAEELIEFMLTDLKRPLMEVGRIAEFNNVSERALKYYKGENANELSPNSLGRRARALHLLGETRYREGDLVAALDVFTDTFATTEKLLALTPDDENRIYEHGQSAFWLARVNLDQGLFDNAEKAMTAYVDLSQRYLSFQPNEFKREADVGRAKTALGGVRVKRGAFKEAVAELQESVAIWNALLTKHPDDDGISAEKANTMGWLGDASEFTGELDEAVLFHQQSLESFIALRKKYKQERDYDNRALTAIRKMAWLKSQQPNQAGLMDLVNEGLARGAELQAYDANNARSKKDVASLTVLKAKIFSSAQRQEEAQSLLSQKIVTDVSSRIADEWGIDMVIETYVESETLKTELAYAQKNKRLARELSTSLLGKMTSLALERSVSPPATYFLAKAYMNCASYCTDTDASSRNSDIEHAQELLKSTPLQALRKAEILRTTVAQKFMLLKSR